MLVKKKNRGGVITDTGERKDNQWNKIPENVGQDGIQNSHGRITLKQKEVAALFFSRKEGRKESCGG